MEKERDMSDIADLLLVSPPGPGLSTPSWKNTAPAAANKHAV